MFISKTRQQQARLDCKQETEDCWDVFLIPKSLFLKQVARSVLLRSEILVFEQLFFL